MYQRRVLESFFCFGYVCVLPPLPRDGSFVRLCVFVCRCGYFRVTCFYACFIFERSELPFLVVALLRIGYTEEAHQFKAANTACIINVSIFCI